MNFNPKAPPVYKPAPPKLNAPPAHRPGQSAAGGVQPKAVNKVALESRPAPPVYRPQQVSAPQIPSRIPGGNRSAHVTAQSGIQRMAIPRSAKTASQPPSRVIQRMESSSGGFDRFVQEAWPVVKAHWENVEETNPGAVVDVRDESTLATFNREGFGPETGKNTNAHAEWTPVDRFYVSFPSSFPQIVKGGTLDCAGNKPSCFLCAAIAHTLGIKIQKKDARGYGGHYALPGFMAEDHILKKFVGTTAFGIYEKAGKPVKWLRELAGALYKGHSSDKSFVVK